MIRPFKVGDKVQAFGLNGQIVYIYNTRDKPIEVLLENNSHYFFTSDGKLEHSHKVPILTHKDLHIPNQFDDYKQTISMYQKYILGISVELDKLKKEQPKTKKYVYPAIVKDTIDGSISTSIKLFHSEDMARKYYNTSFYNNIEFITLGSAIELEI